MDKNFATDCKPVEYALIAIASCVVGGVGYAAGQTIRTASLKSVKYLVAAGAAYVLGEVVELTPEEHASAVAAEEASQAVVPKRVTRSKKRKQG